LGAVTIVGAAALRDDPASATPAETASTTRARPKPHGMRSSALLFSVLAVIE